MTEMLDAAIKCITRGWHVLPLAPGSKHPLGRLAPHGVKDATAAEHIARQWWGEVPEANVGVATGRPSWLFVVDLDGEEGLLSWDELVYRHGAVPTATQRTGGGWQLLYHRPAVAGWLPGGARLHPGLDVRSDGGYVVVPPSVHPSGARYRWAGGVPGWLAECPRWLLAELYAPQRWRPEPAREWPRRRIRGDDPMARAARYGEAALERACAELAGVGPGRRSNALNATAYGLGRLVAGGCLDRRAVERALEATCAHMGYDASFTELDARRTIASGLGSGLNHPRGPRG